MIATIDVDIQAANPNMPLHPWRAYVGSPSSLRLRNVPKRIGDWHITSVKIVAAYPDGEIKTADCVLTGGIWVGTVAGTSTSGTSQNGYTVFADGTDEHGNPVTGYVLGKGDITILEADGSLNPDAPSYYVHLYDEQPEEPHEGDLFPTTDGFRIWQGGQGVSLGITQSQLNSALATKQDKLSQLQLENIAAVPNKRDVDDLQIYADPSENHNPLTVTVWHTENISNDYTLLWDETYISWRYDDGSTSMAIYLNEDGIYRFAATIIDYGGTEHHIECTIDLSAPTWSAAIDDIPGFDRFEIESISTRLATEDFAIKNSGGVAEIKSISQADYDALTPDAATLYVIPEEEA